MRRLLCNCLFASLFSPAIASETDVGHHLDVELNATQQAEAGCQLTFVVMNGHPLPIERAVFETVLFNKGGMVERFTLIDLGQLPPAKPRVRQFVMPNLACNDLGRVLINGAHACTAPGLDPDACSAGLTLSTKSDVEFLG